jgi:hypothetical protein
LTNLNPASGAAVKTIGAPDGALAEQTSPQLMPPTSLVIKPLPPAALTDSFTPVD